jgi:hypothetical protein
VEKLRDDCEMASKVAFCPLWDALAALMGWSVFAWPSLSAKLTQAIRTFLGSDELGSLTLTKANWMRPSENSSTRSTSSPSVYCQHLFEYTRGPYSSRRQAGAQSGSGNVLGTAASASRGWPLSAERMVVDVPVCGATYLQCSVLSTRSLFPRRLEMR